MVSVIFIFIFFTIFVINNNDLTPTYPKKEEEKKNFDPTLSRLLSSLISTHPHHAAAAAPPPLFPQHAFFQIFSIVRDDNNSNRSSSRSRSRRRSRSNFCSTSEQFLSQIILGHGYEWHIWCGREWNVGVAECLVSFQFFFSFFRFLWVVVFGERKRGGKGEVVEKGRAESRKDQLTSPPPGPTKPPFMEKEVSHLFPTLSPSPFNITYLPIYLTHKQTKK